MTSVFLGAVSLDCPDPPALAAFWRTLLDGTDELSAPAHAPA